MRQGPSNKRVRGRSNNRKHGNPRNQSYDSNGPDVKVRGNAQQVVEKYLMLARDASSAGDRITAESYYQHAEHYYRILNAAVANEQRNMAATAPDTQPAVESVEQNGAGAVGEVSTNGSGHPRRRSERQAGPAPAQQPDPVQPLPEKTGNEAPLAEA